MIRKKGGKLIIGHKDFEPRGPNSGYTIFNLSEIGDIFVLGAGKGVQRLAKAIEDVLGSRLTGGHVISKKGDPKILEKIEVTEGAHPVPDEDCIEGSKKILEIAKKAKKNDLVFTVVANGVSSLLTLPAPGISLEDIKKVTYLLQIVRGAPTTDLNPVRNHLSAVKGGKLSRYIHPATMIHIIAWDHEAPAITKKNWIPSLPECTTFADAVQILKRWELWEEVPQSVRKHLETADPRYETLKKEEFERMSSHTFWVQPSKTGMIATAKKKAQELGIKPIILTEGLQAEASEAAKVVAAIANSVELTGQPFKPPCVLITGGEMVVAVGKETGIGGRNQEFVLSAALKISGSENITIASADSDGTDGPGAQLIEGKRGFCLGGGIVDGYTVERAKEKAINIENELTKHNSSPILRKLNDGIIISRGISMNDLTITAIMGCVPRLSN
jgi:glycerate-2-kinase